MATPPQLERRGRSRQTWGRGGYSLVSLGSSGEEDMGAERMDPSSDTNIALAMLGVRRPLAVEAGPDAPLPAALIPPPPTKPKKNERFFRRLHFFPVILILVFVAAAFIANAITYSGVEFIPASLPTHWGTFFLLPLPVQLVFAALTLTTLTSPLWVSVVMSWTVICFALALWSVANILWSLAVYVPTLGGLTLALTNWGLLYELFLCLMIVAFEVPAVAALVPLVWPWLMSPYDPADTRGMSSRLWITLLSLLLFVVITFIFCWHVEPDTRLILEFWPSAFAQHAATIWLVPQPVLYLLAVGTLAVPPGLGEQRLVEVLFIVTIVALITSVFSVISTIIALINYVPTATPFTPVVAGTILVLLASIIAPAIDGIIIALIIPLRRRLVAESDL